MTRFARVASLFAGAVLFISACDRATDVAAPRARAASTRAKLIAAEPRFFFLRPIAKKASFTGEFDATLSPVVEICVWQGNACALPLVSRLTNVKLRGADDDDDAEDAQVEAEPNAHYGVKWKTKGLHLDPAKAYRIRVLVAGTQLGFADVDVVSNAKDAKSVDKALFVPLVAGKNLKIRFRIEKGAVAVRGAAGGSIDAMGGNVHLDIPAGALAGDVGFTVEQTNGVPQPGGFVVPGGTYEFGPDGLVFAQPVQLTLHYDDAGLSPAVESQLRLQKLINGVWVPVPGSTVDVSTNTVTGMIGGFSTYGIVTILPGGIPLFSGYGTAVVDGVLDPTEWAPSASMPLTFGRYDGVSFVYDTGRLYVMNDGVNMYLAVRFARPAADQSNWMLFDFDNDNDGAFETGDDRLLSVRNLPQSTQFFDQWWDLSSPGCANPSACLKSDTLSGGTRNGTAQFANTGGVSVFEIVHPLNSADDLHDFSLSVGDTVGFYLQGYFYTGSVIWSVNGFPSSGNGKILIAGLDSVPPDSIPPDSIPPDSLPPDSLPPDSLPPDSLPPDSLPPDSLPPDSLPPDSLPPDSLPPDSLPPALPFDSGSVTAGYNHSCAIALSGVSYCWGANAHGALGNNNTINSSVPVALWGGHSFRTLSAGSADTTHLGAHTCALDGAGLAYCWGLNNHGQLGNGSTFPEDTAHLIASASAFKSISAGRTYSCAVTLAGAAFCWGRGHVGQLGNGASAGSLVPVAVSGGLTFSMISAGDAHTCGVTIAGDVYCWGANFLGQLGLGFTSVKQVVPQFVIGGFQWVSAGPEHTCGVQVSGQVYCWGRNSRGQLGDGTQINRSSPVAVGGGLGAGYKRVDAGGRTTSSVQVAYSCGVKVSGDAYCWGANTFGQLGNGGSPGFVYVFPSLVTGGHQFRNVSAGVDHTCGVTLAGSTYCWGSSANGGLGNGGAPAPFATPVLVSGGLFYH